MKEPCIFISYVHADQSWAEQFSSLLVSSGIAICSSWSSLKPGEDFEARLRESIGTATHTVVLVGPQTRFSRWVDREIEQSTESREDGPGAALIGVILPSHEDFSRLYYEYWLLPQAFQAATEFSAVREWLDAAGSHLRIESVDGFLLFAGSLPKAITGPIRPSPTR